MVQLTEQNFRLLSAALVVNSGFERHRIPARIPAYPPLSLGFLPRCRPASCEKALM